MDEKATTASLGQLVSKMDKKLKDSNNAVQKLKNELQNATDDVKD